MSGEVLAGDPDTPKSLLRAPSRLESLSRISGLLTTWAVAETLRRLHIGANLEVPQCPQPNRLLPFRRSPWRFPILLLAPRQASSPFAPTVLAQAALSGGRASL